MEVKLQVEGEGRVDRKVKMQNHIKKWMAQRTGDTWQMWQPKAASSCTGSVCGWPKTCARLWQLFIGGVLAIPSFLQKRERKENGGAFVFSSVLLCVIQSCQHDFRQAGRHSHTLIGLRDTCAFARNSTAELSRSWLISHWTGLHSSQIFVGIVYTNGCTVYIQTCIVCTRGGAALRACSYASACVLARKSTSLIHTNTHTHTTVCVTVAFISTFKMRSFPPGPHRWAFTPTVLQACWMSKHHMCTAKTRAFPGPAFDPRRSHFAHTYLRQGLIKTLLIYRPVRASANLSGACEHTSAGVVLNRRTVAIFKMMQAPRAEPYPAKINSSEEQTICKNK